MVRKDIVQLTLASVYHKVPNEFVTNSHGVILSKEEEYDTDSDSDSDSGGDQSDSSVEIKEEIKKEEEKIKSEAVINIMDDIFDKFEPFDDNKLNLVFNSNDVKIEIGYEKGNKNECIGIDIKFKKNYLGIHSSVNKFNLDGMNLKCNNSKIFKIKLQINDKLSVKSVDIINTKIEIALRLRMVTIQPIICKFCDDIPCNVFFDDNFGYENVFFFIFFFYKTVNK